MSIDIHYISHNTRGCKCESKAAAAMAKDQSQSEVAVVIVPFTSQGHLNQLLQLSGLISTYGLPIHFVITATHSRQAKQRQLQCTLDLQSRPNIHFHEFEIPNFTSPLPDPNTPCKFPSHLQPSFDASLHLHEPVRELLRTLASTARRVVVIHDSLMSSVVRDVVSIPNAEAYMFRPLSVFSFYCNFLKNPSETEPELHTLHCKSVSSIEGCFSPEFVEFFTYQHSFQNFYSGILYDSSILIEGKYLDYLTKEESNSKIKHWGLGPFNPVEVASTPLDQSGSNGRHRTLAWLDEQDKNSVIYVSFGTTTCLSDEQIQELAIGLDESGQKFIWVLRDADLGDVSGGGVERIALPKGYEERVAGKGLIVRDWVPQLEILAHPNTGGFMSHCGWNSSMESMTMGVPIATWPMHSDQPRNAVLINDVLKIGVVVKDWECTDEVVTSLEIKNAVRKLMCSEEGDEIRKRAEDLGGDIRRSVAAGGVTRVEFDKFIAHITR